MHCPTSLASKAMAVVALMLPYVGGVYFRAATASLSDDHQPGMESLKLCIQPGLVLLLPLLLAWLTKARGFMQVARWSSVCGLFACIVLLVFCVSHGPSSGVQWLAAGTRSLATTVQQALFQPSFSNRSVASVAGSAVFAMGLLMLNCFVCRQLRQPVP